MRCCPEECGRELRGASPRRGEAGALGSSLPAPQRLIHHRMWFCLLEAATPCHPGTPCSLPDTPAPTGRGLHCSGHPPPVEQPQRFPRSCRPALVRPPPGSLPPAILTHAMCPRSRECPRRWPLHSGGTLMCAHQGPAARRALQLRSPAAVAGVWAIMVGSKPVSPQTG